MLADAPTWRRKVAGGGYATTAVFGAATGAATAVWQVGVLRAVAWTARDLRAPVHKALLADIVPATAYGRACGFERMMDSLGACMPWASVVPPLRVSRVRVRRSRALLGVRGARPR